MIIQYEGTKYKCDDNFSLKDFTGYYSFEEDLSGKVIYGSSFYKETPDTNIFPSNMRGVVFINCNLDNVVLPPNNMMLGGFNRRFQAQSDGKDWLIDENNQPVSLLNPNEAV